MLRNVISITMSFKLGALGKKKKIWMIKKRVLLFDYMIVYIYVLISKQICEVQQSYVPTENLENSSICVSWFQ